MILLVVKEELPTRGSKNVVDTLLLINKQSKFSLSSIDKQFEYHFENALTDP
jgi:hypothetical protein